jgi:arylsulfatase A-like enzyme
MPGRVPPRQVSEALVSNIDVAPTMLDAAGLAFDADVHGRSILPLAAGEAGDWRDDLMCETHGHGHHHIGRLVVTDRYKYVANKGDMDELYDLSADPYEMANLVDDPDHTHVLADLRARLTTWQEKTGDSETDLS